MLHSLACAQSVLPYTFKYCSTIYWLQLEKVAKGKHAYMYTTKPIITTK